jgi:hypothetical protein
MVVTYHYFSKLAPLYPPGLGDSVQVHTIKQESPTLLNIPELASRIITKSNEEESRIAIGSQFITKTTLRNSQIVYVEIFSQQEI